MDKRFTHIVCSAGVPTHQNTRSPVKGLAKNLNASEGPTLQYLVYNRIMNSEVRGLDLDRQTRCRHYHGPTDIVAIKMRCCGVFYACKDCHAALAGHPIEVWPKSKWNHRAILCGACRTELTIQQYLEDGFQCTVCHARFNPGCKNHYHFYFAG